jgi:hypothetical protein
MSEENQIVVPSSFIALFLAPGSVRPTETRETIAERHELCEDLAQMLTEHALARKFELGVTEGDVLERMLQGLRASRQVTDAEAEWVGRRLAELLHWPLR